MTNEQIVKMAEQAGFQSGEIALLGFELAKFADLIQANAMNELLRAPEGYVMYTPCRLH